MVVVMTTVYDSSIRDTSLPLRLRLALKGLAVWCPEGRSILAAQGNRWCGQCLGPSIPHIVVAEMSLSRACSHLGDVERRVNEEPRC